MLKKILIITIIILTLLTIALGVRIYLDEPNNSVVGQPDEERGVFGFLNIGGNTADIDTSQPQTRSSDSVANEENVTSPNNSDLLQLTTKPTAGATFVGTSTVRYVDRGTGHIYETDLVSMENTKISNTTIPKVYKALWLNNGTEVLYRQLEGSTIKTTLIELDNEPTTEEELLETRTTNLPDNISSLDISPNKSRIVALIESQVFIGEPDSLSEPNFTIPGESWLVEWIDVDTLSFTTKASSETTGSSYTTNLSGSLIKLIGDRPSLTTKSNSVITLYSDKNVSEESGIRLNYIHRETGERDFITSSIPEKCVFLSETDTTLLCAIPQNTTNTFLPESWYKGEISFNDSFHLINLEREENFIINQPTQPVDAIYPHLNSNNSRLLFLNKKDLTLWSLTLKN